MRAAVLLLMMAACSQNQRLSVEYESKISSDRDAVVCRYYERELTELYVEQARATDAEQKKALEAESTALERLFVARCVRNNAED